MVGSMRDGFNLKHYTKCRLDALAGIGHACGHNLIAIVSLGGALATAKTLADSDLGGKVVLFGTPAEGSLSRSCN